jgi:hypothetical protein
VKIDPVMLVKLHAFRLQKQSLGVLAKWIQDADFSLAVDHPLPGYIRKITAAQGGHRVANHARTAPAGDLGNLAIRSDSTRRDLANNRINALVKRFWFAHRSSPRNAALRILKTYMFSSAGLHLHVVRFDSTPARLVSYLTKRSGEAKRAIQTMEDVCFYQILIRGKVDESDLNINSPLILNVQPSGDACSLLSARTDQAGLVGLIRHLHGQGFILLSINCISIEENAAQLE